MPYKAGTRRKTVGFSEEEWEVVCDRAKKMKLPVSGYIRKIAVQGEIKFYDLTELHSLMYSFNSIGSLLNQIAKVANSTNSIYQKDIEDMQEKFEYFDDVMHDYEYYLLCTARKQRYTADYDNKKSTIFFIESRGFFILLLLWH